MHICKQKVTQEHKLERILIGCDFQNKQQKGIWYHNLQDSAAAWQIMKTCTYVQENIVKVYLIQGVPKYSVLYNAAEAHKSKPKLSLWGQIFPWT